MGKIYHEEEDMSTSCISSEPTMQCEVWSSTLRAFQPNEDELQLDETEAHESVRASLVKLSAMLVFMLSSLVAISATGSVKALRCPSEWLLNGVPTRGRILGSLYPPLQTPDKTHLAIGSAALLVLATLMYFAPRQIQRKGNTCSVGKSVIDEDPAELPSKNDAAVSPEVCPGSSPSAWTPELEVNLELENSPGEMSSSEKMSPPQKSADTRQKYDRRPRRKSMSTITHTVLARDSSVGSSASCDKSRPREAKSEVHLRRSTRIRNKGMSRDLCRQLDQC